MSDPISAEVSKRICAHMNEDHANAVLLYAQTFGSSPDATAAEMLSIDPQGMNLAAQINGAAVPIRIQFDRALENSEDAHHSWQKYSHLWHDVGGVKSLPLHFHFERIDPPRLNYAALYPIAKRIWDCFSEDIERSIDISVDQLSG